MADYADVILENEKEDLDNLEYSGNENIPVFATVRVAKKDFSVFELYRKFRKKQLILDVDFQRKEVWEQKQKYELIESILMGLPLPIFYFKQQDNATYVVVDGKQRLSALFEYLNDGFALRGLKILGFLNGRKFSDLTGEYGVYQSQLEDYQVYSHLILPPTPDKILFDIFDRVNRGGTKLNKQEIRNALYHGKGLDMINEITETEAFRKATRIEPSRDKRMKGSYLLTRFFAFYLLFHEYLMKDGKPYQYNGDVDDLIQTALTWMNRTDSREVALMRRKLKKLSIDCLEQVYSIFGEGAFRKGLKRSNPINMNIFETTMYFMALMNDYDLTGMEKIIKEEVYEVITSNQYLSCLSDSRESYQKVSGRFKLMEKLAKELQDD